MEKMIGKTFSIPEDLHNGVRKIQKERNIAFQSAKILLEEAVELQKGLVDIIDENVPNISGYEYILDVNSMQIIVVKEKKSQL